MGWLNLSVLLNCSYKKIHAFGGINTLEQYKIIMTNNFCFNRVILQFLTIPKIINNLLLWFLRAYFQEGVKILELHLQSIIECNTIYTALLTVQPNVTKTIFWGNKCKFCKALKRNCIKLKYIIRLVILYIAVWIEDQGGTSGLQEGLYEWMNKLDTSINRMTNTPLERAVAVNV